MTMSIAQRAGLTDAFQTTLLILALVLALTPYLSAVSIGVLTIPRLSTRQRRWMKIIGPITIAIVVALVTPLSALAPAPALEVLAAEATDAGQIDVVVTNKGGVAVLLTRLELEVIGDRGGRARPMLLPSAGVRVPVDGLPVGGRGEVMLRQLIPARATERLIVDPATTRPLDLRLRLREAGGRTLSVDVRLWPGPARR